MHGSTELGRLARIALRLAAALIVGFVIGIQRELTGKPAGLRTHLLVALGTALLIVTALDAGMNSTGVGRVVQGVITGIGFLGGGTILKLTQEHEIRGLTTAAGIWLTAAASVAAGFGLYADAFLAALFALIVLTVLGRLEAHRRERTDRRSL